MSGPDVDPSSDRRSRLTLRETLDDLIDYVRGVTTNSSQLSDEELEYAQQRLQWLADEVFRAAVERDSSIDG